MGILDPNTGLVSLWDEELTYGVYGSAAITVNNNIYTFGGMSQESDREIRELGLESRVDKWMKYTFNSFSTSETPSSSTSEPSESPSFVPTDFPSLSPSETPTSTPSSSSSFVPTRSPNVNPSDSLTGKPSMVPSKRPTFNSTGETIEITPSGAPMHLDLILASSVAGGALFCCILSMGLSKKWATAVDNQTKSSGELEEPLSDGERDIEAMMDQVGDFKIIENGNDADA